MDELATELIKRIDKYYNNQIFLGKTILMYLILENMKKSTLELLKKKI